jgi:hypothetical protein
MSANVDSTQWTEWQGKWERLEDGTFGASIRFKNHENLIDRCVGKIVTLTSKAGKRERVVLIELIKDYGINDVTIFRCERLMGH